jgi:hypothetical protein
MRNVYSHIKGAFEFTERIPRETNLYTIVPKRFTVMKVSELGEKYLSFRPGEERTLQGRLVTERFPGAGRVFFLPHSVQPNLDPETSEFIEIKGYGQDGREMCLWLHCDGDILFGMFYKNARKEFNILEKAFSSGLKVPIPLFIGKIPRREWLSSGLRVVNKLSRDNKQWDLEKLAMMDLDELREEVTKQMNKGFHDREDVLSAFAQPYNAGVMGRAVLSPLRLGDPTKRYDLTEENKTIARQCGNTFFELIDLGFLHLSPGTGNWTEAGEFTDMADCYDLKKDKNLDKVISSREEETQQEFWRSLIGLYHTSNLSPFFVEGMLGESVSLTEAADEVEKKTSQKIKELRG